MVEGLLRHYGSMDAIRAATEAASRSAIFAWEGKHKERYPGIDFGHASAECWDIGDPFDSFQWRRVYYHEHMRRLHKELGRTLVGLEVGALHHPAPVPFSLVNMTYADSTDSSGLRMKYPELNANEFAAAHIVTDAETLTKVDDASYDVLIESHLLEHTRHFLLALQNGLRVLKEGGLYFIMLPNMCTTFDRFRVQTSWEHLLLEYLQPSLVDTNEFEHHREWALSHHTSTGKYEQREDLPGAFEFAQKTFSSPMLRRYYIHYHTFTPRSAAQIFAAARVVITSSAFEVVDFYHRQTDMAIVLRKVNKTSNQVGRKSFMTPSVLTTRDIYDALL